MNVIDIPKKGDEILKKQEILELAKLQSEKDLNNARSFFEELLDNSIKKEYWSELGIAVIPPDEIHIHSSRPDFLHRYFTFKVEDLEGVFKIETANFANWVYSLQEQKIYIAKEALLKFVCFKIM